MALSNKSHKAPWFHNGKNESSYDNRVHVKRGLSVVFLNKFVKILTDIDNIWYN